MVDITLIELHMDDAKLSTSDAGGAGKLLGLLGGRSGSKQQSSGQQSGSETRGSTTTSGDEDEQETSSGGFLSRGKSSSGESTVESGGESTGESSSEGTDESSTEEDEQSGGAMSKLKPLVGLLVLVAVAALVRKRQGSEGSMPDIDRVEA